MKIAVTAQDKQMTSPLDPRFGRAKYFLVVDTEGGEFTPVDNTQNLNAPQGAGIQSGRTVAGLGVEAVLTGHVGPKAFATLQAAGIKVYAGVSGTVAEAMEQYNAGALAESTDADVQGHWA
ncbi:MAG: NifB/NifX family molybdenum-iron cluster-binding protein [Phycisphaerae bacterium]